MANTLGVYNPTFFAQEALIQLEAVMGLANRVYLGYDEERRAFGRGETINIRRPSAFTAQNAPSAAQDLNTETVGVTLSEWKEVKFALTDKELAFTRERIIADHIRPAAVALADDIDKFLAAFAAQIPWQHLAATPATVADITQVRKIQFDNKVPLRDPMMMHYMANGRLEADFLGLAAFSQQQGAGDAGVNTQMGGNLGQKFGYQVWANQNAAHHTAGSGTITNLAVDVDQDAGATEVDLKADAVTTGTLLAGDTIKFAGHAQAYVITENPTFATNAGTVKIFPALKADILDDEEVEVQRYTGEQGLAFHRNAFSLVTAPLSELGHGRGAEIASVQDPITGLSLRSRIYYDGDNSKLNVALDVLYGGVVLDPNLAVRVVDGTDVDA